MKRSLVTLSLAFGLLCAAYAAIQATRNRSVLIGLWGDWAYAVLLGGAASVIATAVLLLWIRQQPAPHAARSPVLLVCGFCLVVLWAAAYQTWLQPYERFTVEATIPIVVGAYALLVAALGSGKLRIPPVLARTVCAICLGVVLLDLALRGLSIAYPSPVLTTSSHSAPVQLRSGLFAPGEVRYGSACNSAGFFDTEFLAQPERTHPTIVMVGDSFSAGIVPLPYHFTSVAERILGNVEIYNMGVPAIGPQVYRYLVEELALPLSPEAVIVNLFVGNDLADLSVPSGVDRLLRAGLDQQYCYVRVFVDRMLALHRTGRPIVLRYAPDLHSPVIEDPVQRKRWFPWLDDHNQERPSHSVEDYLDLAVRRAYIACTPHKERLALLFELLAQMRELCAPMPFGVVLIPAEFQVEDELWSRVEAELQVQQPYEIVRDRMQTEVRAWCEQQGMALLDLLPPLRAERLFEDGSRHLYHLRDTHFNVRGNNVAGREMARFARELLGSQPVRNEKSLR